MRGTIGPVGERGGKGARGKIGHAGAQGPPLTRSARAELFDGVEGQIEEIHHELSVQMKRMAQLQERVDEVRGAIRELTTAR